MHVFFNYHMLITKITSDYDCTHAMGNTLRTVLTTHTVSNCNMRRQGTMEDTSFNYQLIQDECYVQQ